MESITLNLTDLQINRADIYLNLGYGGQNPDEQIMEMIEQIIVEATHICHPKIGYIINNGSISNKDFLQINETSIKIGRVIARYYADASHFAVFVATAGLEFDKYLHQLRLDGDIVNEFLADAVGSEIAEATVRYVYTIIAEKAKELDLFTTQSYSPGYCSWHVREQQALFSLLPPNPCDIVLNESSLMFPVKSVSGIIGLGTEIKVTPYACDICGLKTCYKRKKNTFVLKE
jgi:hypothetical protein